MSDERSLPLGQTRAQPEPTINLEEDRHWWFSSRTAALLGVLDRFLEAGERPVLDVGCGAGNMFHHLRRYGPVVGVDPNPRPLAVARQRGYDVQQGSAEAIPWGDDTFGLVALLDTVEHCADDAAVLRECGRVCRPGGWLIVTSPAFMWLWSHNDVLNAHYRRYTARELGDKLRTAGFRVRYLTYNNFFVFPLAASLILLRSHAAQKPQLASPHFDEDAYQVEMEPVPPLLNSILTGVGQVEAALLRRVPLPFGISLIALVQKES
ncbi:MAG: methyltransferase domain-containing protein [Anaerolineae bacterium]|nr:methyltransferase domain-containing protein [Anaerolineae bacterium]